MFAADITCMIGQFLFGLPLFFLAVFGLFHMSELGFFVGAADQASFFAARSMVVGQDPDIAVKLFSAAAIDPMAAKEKEESEVATSTMKFQAFKKNGETYARVQSNYSSILPNRDYTGMPLLEEDRTRFVEADNYSQASTLVPQLEGDEE